METVKVGTADGRTVAGIFRIGKVSADGKVRFYGTGATAKDGTKVPTVGVKGSGKVAGSVSCGPVESKAILDAFGGKDAAAWKAFVTKVAKAADARKVIAVALPAVEVSARGRKASTVKVSADDTATLDAIRDAVK